MGQTKNRTGAATVEFAMVCVLLFVLIFAGIEFTRLSMLRHTADHAAYLAARDAIIPGVDTTTVIQTAENHLTTVGVVGAVVTVIPNPIAEDTEQVEVTVAIPVANNSLVIPSFASGNLLGRSRLMTERSPMEMSTSLPKPPVDPPNDPESPSDPPGIPPLPPPPPPPML